MKKERRYRLDDSTLVEPLINRWAAWAHLISPVPASLHLVDYQIKVMRSFLENPESHIIASRDPNMIGGPIVEFPIERTSEIQELLTLTESTQRGNIEFAQAIMRFYNILVKEATGQCLESFYECVPETLRGYVELVYDYYHRPTIRFLEGLLYESDYYNVNLQSLRLSRLEHYAARRFFMSTPRLLEPEQIDWLIPFERSKVDELFKLDTEPQPLGYIKELLGFCDIDPKCLLNLLTEEPTSISAQWNEPVVRFRYFGHASVLTEWNGLSVLTDPYVAVRPARGGMEQWSYNDLPRKIDYVLITHNHQDHFALESILRLRHRIGCVVVPKSSGQLYGDVSLKLMLRKLGFKNVVELDTLESIRLPAGEIIAVPFFGEHGDLAHAKCAYVVRAGREQILFAADSDCLDSRMYERLRKSLGKIETVFLGMECVGAPLTWSCGPLFPEKPPRNIDQTRRHHGCDSNAALKIIEAVGARRVYNYAMGMEPWLEHLLGLNLSPDSRQIKESDRFLAKAGETGGVIAERLFGKDEFYMNGDSKKRRIAALPIPEREEKRSAILESGPSAGSDAEDQFTF